MHGTRRSYATGCRCLPCRLSNARYRSTPRVPATLARQHLASLVRAGVGTRQLALDTGIARSTIRAVLDGSQTTLRASTHAALLAARPVLAHGATVPATTTWRFLDSLHRDGYTAREVAFHLGHTAQQIQLAPKRIRVRSALAVATVYRRLAC